MGGKGKRRREKNYRAAHGGNTRLPPPPEPSSLDALPSKLRKLMAFTSQVDDEQKVKKTDSGRRKPRSEADISTKKHGTMKEDGDVGSAFQNINSDDGNVHDSTDPKKRKKRKKAQVDGLRFAAELEKLGVCSSRRERKKEYLKAKKKKHKKAGIEDNLDAPKKDHVKFGEIVEAPPKLAVVPKGPKKPVHASQERLRLQAVEAYRSRRQWTSRPGIHLPPPLEN